MTQSKRAPQTVSSRRSLVADLVSANRVHSQQELLDLMRGKGFSVTQATLSRDLEALGAAKSPDPEGSGAHYIVPSELSAEYSQVMVVVHTPPGGAQFLAGHLDRSGRFDTLGTVAGDDTIFLIARSETQAKKSCNDLVALAESGT